MTHRRNIPTYPGALTPAQLIRHALTTAATATDYQNHGTIAASVAMRGKTAASDNQKIRTMQNSRKADELTEAAADKLTKAGELKTKAAELQEEAKNHRTYANQSGRTPAEVRANRAKAKALDKTAAKLTREAKALEDSTEGRTFSDFQPIKHEAILGRLAAEVTAYTVTPEDMSKAAARFTEAVKAHEAPAGLDLINAAMSAAAMVEHDPGILFEMAYSGAIFRAATNAANKAITANLHHDSHNRTTEQKTLVTPEIMEAWRAVHGENSGKGYKVFLDRDNANWHTMEYRTYKTEASGWYLVHHHKTIAPNVSLEAYTEDSHGGQAELVTNGGIPMVETQEARERLEAVLDNANFTERERNFTRYFLSPKAAHAGQAAVNEALATKTRARRAKAEAKAASNTAAVTKTKEAQEAAEAAQRAAKAAEAEAVKVPNDTELIRYRGMTEAAAAHIGIQTRSQLDNFTSRWRARAAEAVGIEQGCTTPEEAAEAEAKAWTQMQKNRTRGGKEAEAVQVLFVGIDSPEAIQKAAAQLAKAAKGKRATKADKARAEKAAEATKPTKATWKPGEAITMNFKYTDSHGNTHAWSEAVSMSNTTRAAEAITPGIDYRGAEVEARAEAQAKHAEAHTAQHRRNQYRKDNFTGRTSCAAYAAHDAQAAALVFWDAMTTAEQDATIAAESMTARERREAAERAARLAEVEALAATIEEADKAKPGKTYTAAEVEAMRARARERAAQHDHIMSKARATERARAAAK